MRLSALAQSLAGPIILIAIWFLLSGFGFVSSVLPSPTATFGRLYELVQTQRFGQDFVSTTYRWLTGYLAGCAIGIPIGLMLGARPAFYRVSEFPLDFLRSLPVTAVFPLFLLMFGIGDASKIAMVFAATVFVVALNSAYGVLNSTPARIRMAKSFGATDQQIFRKVILFEAMPQILIGARTTLSLSLIVVIVSEMFIGTRYGLGQRVFESYQTNRVADLYALLIIIGLFGYVLNKVFIAAERKFVYWAGQ